MQVVQVDVDIDVVAVLVGSVAEVLVGVVVVVGHEAERCYKWDPAKWPAMFCC